MRVWPFKMQSGWARWCQYDPSGPCQNLLLVSSTKSSYLSVIFPRLGSPRISTEKCVNTAPDLKFSSPTKKKKQSRIITETAFWCTNERMYGALWCLSKTTVKCNKHKSENVKRSDMCRQMINSCSYTRLGTGLPSCHSILRYSFNLI